MLKNNKQLVYSKALVQFLETNYIPYQLQDGTILIALKDYRYFDYLWSSNPVIKKQHCHEVALAGIQPSRFQYQNTVDKFISLFKLTKLSWFSRLSKNF